jgi:hypothetical protein
MTTEATAQQPRPAGQGPDITPLVIADLEARSAQGALKYGEPLRAFNGRDALADAYQESLDQTQYLRQEIEERRARAQLIPMLQKVCAYIETKEDLRPYSEVTPGKVLYCAVLDSIALLASQGGSTT